MSRDLRAWAEERGWRVTWGPLQVVDEAYADVGTRNLSSALLAYASESFTAVRSGDLRARGLSSVVVVARPRPAHSVVFEAEGGPREALLPPTYQRYRDTFEDVRLELQRTALAGSRVKTLGAPLKQVAARLGLVSYGRNNIAYISGLGSWFQLLGYVTDAPLPPAPPGPSAPALLDRCVRCRACLNACPTGAVQADRILLDADRCLTFVNEQPGAWPRWVESDAHHTLLGCLACQTICPENPRLPVEPSGVVFSREETRALLADPEERIGAAWDGVREKLALLGQSYSEDVVGRNLKAFLAAHA